MKALLVGEYRKGKLLGTFYELVAFAQKLGAKTATFVVGSENEGPKVDGPLYVADAEKYGEYNPDVHKQLLLEVIKKENPDYVVFAHSSYGWDLAPRVALARRAAQVSEVVDVVDGTLVVPVCNSKMRRKVKSKSDMVVVTVQAGAFCLESDPVGSPSVTRVEVSETASRLEFTGYEVAEKGGVDLTKAKIIVSAGRGIGKKDNLKIIAQLAEALGGELGASRPVVDAEWATPDRQVGTTGQTVAPKLYVACGISGAIQHLAGMKKSDFIVAINKDKEAPIGEVANVLIVADVMEFVPALLGKL